MKEYIAFYNSLKGMKGGKLMIKAAQHDHPNRWLNRYTIHIYNQNEFRN
jgi:hypothetical protein